MKIGTHFDRSEFACKCGCGFDTVDVKLLEVLEGVRAYFDVPVYVNSACRCVAHNHSVGGSPRSQHVKGRAADIRVLGHTPQEVADYVESMMKSWGGVGVYPKKNFVHVDTRSGDPARWHE